MPHLLKASPLIGHVRKIALLGLFPLAACASDRLSLAPNSPDRPWIATTNSASQAGLSSPPYDPIQAARGNAAPIEAGRHYDLAGLIDLAQRNNPQTREAWERARQAALAVGLNEAAFLPQLSAEILGGFQRVALPIPQTVVAKGYFTTNAREGLPSLVAKWLLFDFGQRAGAVQTAEANSFVANIEFTSAHQKLIYAVSRDYFALGAARGRLSVARQSLKTAEVIQDAVEQKRANGLATVVQASEARRQTAQARFTLERTIGAEHAAYASLIESVGVAPSARVETADSSELRLPSFPSGDLELFIHQALDGRPDILAAMGKIRAAEATLSSARAAYYPTVGLEAQVFENIGAFNVQGGPYYSVNQPGSSVLLKLSMPLYDGGTRDARIAMARSEIYSAQDHLDHARDSAVKQVTDAYDSLKTGFAEYEAAVTLVEAAKTAYDAALESYRHGVGTYTDLVNDEKALSQAQSEQEDAHANIFTAAAALAFATGSILSQP